MRTILSCALCCALLSGTAIGQAQTDSTTHSFGLRFIFYGFSTRGGLGAKLWLSKASAIAIDLEVNSQSTNRSEYSSTYQTFSVAFDYEHHFHVSNDLSFFALGRPLVGYERSSYSYDYQENNSDDTYWILSLGLGIGVEYWITSNISLSTNQTLTYSNRFRSTGNNTRKQVSLAASHMVLSFYF